MNETRSVATIEVHGRKIVGTYHGGAYIDLHFGDSRAPAFEVINVYDYAAGKSTIENTPEAILAEMREWADNPSLEHDLVNYAESVRGLR